jgi:hypothetical protein
MELLDLKKELKHFYHASAKEVTEVEIPDHEIYLSDIRKADPKK